MNANLHFLSTGLSYERRKGRPGSISRVNALREARFTPSYVRVFMALHVSQSCFGHRKLFHSAISATPFPRFTHDRRLFIAACFICSLCSSICQLDSVYSYILFFMHQRTYDSEANRFFCSRAFVSHELAPTDGSCDLVRVKESVQPIFV
jgi:hypothetical protein